MLIMMNMMTIQFNESRMYGTEFPVDNDEDDAVN